MVAVRPYQVEAIKKIREAWLTDDDVLCVMATGLGKTLVACALIEQLAQADPTARFLFIAHRKELIEQPRDRMLGYYPHWAGRIGLIMADYDQCDKQMTVATVQTLSVEKRLERYIRNGIPTYLVTDECHHSTSTSYTELVKVLKSHNPNLKHLGVTATPMRADGAGLRAVYTKTAFKMDIRDGIKQGWLVPPRWLAIKTGISLAGVKSNNGDYSASGLADVFETDNCLDLVVESHKKYATDRRALAFTASVAGAHTLADKFNDAGIKAAAADGTTDKATRADVLRRFRAGELQVLCNMGIYTEGLDVPEVSCIHQVRPTKSDGLYIQIMGRALRPVPGKEDALILEYCPRERNIVMCGDVLGIVAKKEVYLKPEKEIEDGDVLGGFTFDGEAKWLKGDPMELISRHLDYLNMTPWVWSRGDDGYTVMGLGKGADGLDRTLIMSPVAEKMTLFVIGRNMDNPLEAPRMFQRHGTLEELQAWAESYASEHGNAILIKKQANWRAQEPTEKQIAYAKRLKAWKDGMSKGQCAEAITYAMALRTLRTMNALPEMKQ